MRFCPKPGLGVVTAERLVEGDCESGLTGVRGVVVRGAGPGCNSVEVSERLARLKEELVALTERERELDEHKTWVQQSISNVTDDVHNHQYPLATRGSHARLVRCSLLYGFYKIWLKFRKRKVEILENVKLKF